MAQIIDNIDVLSIATSREGVVAVQRVLRQLREAAERMDVMDANQMADFRSSVVFVRRIYARVDQLRKEEEAVCQPQ